MAVTAANPLTQRSLEQLRQRTSAKWREHPPDVLPLWVAEMDTPLAPPIADVLTTAIARGDTGYPVGRPYVEALRDFAARRWGWDGVDVDRAAMVPDVMMGVVEALRLITEPGDVVVVCPPVYPPFYAFATHAGRRVAEAPLGPDGRLDLDSLERAFADAARVCAHPVLLNSNPHNPTGTVHTRAELEAAARLAQRHGVRVISDEIHAPVVLAGARFTPYLSVEGAGDAFALMSASKAWNLAGLKAALLLAGPDAVDDLARLPEEVSHGPSHLGVLAHTAAYTSGEPWLEALLAGLEDNRELLGRLLSEQLPAIGYHAPEGTYLAWLDCRGLALGDDPPPSDEPGVVTDLAGPARFFLDHARVALSSGHVFGAGGAGHVRLNFATRPDILTDALTRMGNACRSRAS